MKNFIVMVITLFMLTASLGSRADSGNIQRFIGLWEGVDPEDGAHHVLSITNHGDGTVELLLYATFFSLCDGGRAVAQGTAHVSAKSILKPDDYPLTCFETGDTVNLNSTFTLNADGTLTEDRSAFKPPSPPVTYHRTSN